MAANTTFVSGAILTAAQMNALPWGIVDATAGGTSGRGYVTRTSGNYSMTTSFADVTGLTITFTPVTGRLYKASFSAWLANVATNQDLSVRITDGSNNFIQGIQTYLVSGNNAPAAFHTILTGLSGSTTLKVRAKAATASGALVVASSGSEGAAVFSIEDIGPSA